MPDNVFNRKQQIHRNWDYVFSFYSFLDLTYIRGITAYKHENKYNFGN